MNSRWVILRHTLSKDSLDGLHYDLLLEDYEYCRTWRLPRIPKINGSLVEAISISPHKLHWLDKEESEVSGGRGWAKRIYGGTFIGSLPLSKSEILSVEIRSTSLKGKLEIVDGLCRISSNSKFDFI